MPKYLVEEKRGRWGKRKWVYTAFLEVTFPDGKKKVYRVKQTKYTAGAKPSPRWTLTRGQMKSLIKPTSARHWQIRMIMDSHGYPLDKKWGTPNLKGNRGVSVAWDLEHMRGGYYYDFRPKENLIHAGSSHLATYDLRPKFPMRILPEVPASALKKAQKTAGKTEIPRLGTAKEMNVFLMYPSERVARLNKIQRVLKAVQQRKRENPTPAELKRIKKREAHAIKERTKVEKIIAMSRKKRKT